MSRFNAKTPSKKTVNAAGGRAYKESTKLEFVSLLLTSFVKDQFYRSATDTVEQLRALIASIPDKKFAAKAALFARREFGMRSITHVAAGEIAKLVKGQEWTKNFFEKIVYRPDDASEIVAYYGNTYGKPFPNSLKKGLALALARMKPYELAKYRGEGKDVKLVDIANIAHPRHTDAIGDLVAGKLKNTETWEAGLTKAGQDAENEEEKAELKNAAWSKLLKENKLGYFALLRNIRNITQQAPELIDLLCEQLVDEGRVKKSLVLPFRFRTAMENVDTSDRRIVKALSKAMDISLSNVPKFPGKTLVALDTSGSMNGQPIQIGSLFAAALFKSNDADLMRFAERASFLKLNPEDSISTLTEQIIRKANGGGTNFHSIFEEAQKKYDRIFILSDMQGWMNYDTPTKVFAAYRKRAGANPKIYSFDLQGYGTLQFPEDNVYAFAGFSEKVFDVVKMFEEDKDALIKKIEQIEL